MKFSSRDFEKFAFGCDRVETTAFGFRFHRISRAVATIYQENPALRMRMECTSGVRIRFAATTRCIALGLMLRSKDYARGYFQGTVHVDGQFQSAFGPEQYQERWEGRVFQHSVATPRVFEIWLPHLCEADLAFLDVEEPCEVKAAPNCACRWLVYGDSITHGSAATLPDLTYVGRCATALNADFLNLGVGSATLDSRLADAVPAYPFDLASIAYGANDFALHIPPATVATNACRLLTALFAARPAAMAFMITPTPWMVEVPPNDLGLTLEDYRTAVRNGTRGFPNAHVLEGESLLPAKKQLFADNIHPNDEGMARYGEALTVRIEKVLRGMGGHFDLRESES